MSVISLRKAVTVGPLKAEYAGNMYRWMCDPVVSDNLGLRSEPSLDRTSQWIERSMQANDVRVFSILLDDRHVGNVVIDQIDEYLGKGRLSVYVGEVKERSAAVGLTGMYLAIQQTFDELGLHKIWLTVHARNFKAISTYNKLGFVLEGILRDEFLLGVERLPVLYMGLLSTDFRRLTVSRT